MHESRTCHGGWEVWVHGVSAIICMSKLIRVMSVVSHYVCSRNYIYIYIYIYIYTHIYILIHTQCAILYKNMVFVVTDIGSLLYSSCYYILLLQ